MSTAEVLAGEPRFSGAIVITHTLGALLSILGLVREPVGETGA